MALSYNERIGVGSPHPTFYAAVALPIPRSNRMSITHTLRFAIAALVAVSLTTAADFKRDIIYQIVTDRFFDGDTSNNNPPQSSGLFDST